MSTFDSSLKLLFILALTDYQADLEKRTLEISQLLEAYHNLYCMEEIALPTACDRFCLLV